MCALNALAGLQVLVDLEEVLDFKTVEFRDVFDLGTPCCTLVGCGNAQDLIVTALFVAHTEHAQCAAADHAAREGRFFKQNQCIQGVAVFTQGIVDEAVVIGIASRGEEHTIQTDASRFVVDLVLVSVSLRNLDGHVEFH